jgi:hypothetical protein
MPCSKSDIVRAIVAAYISNDREAVEYALTEELNFTCPYDDGIDKVTYFERCWRDNDWIEWQEC